MVLQVGDACTTCLYIYLQERKKKLDIRDHCVQYKLQISGPPATAIQRSSSDLKFSIDLSICIKNKNPYKLYFTF